MSSLIQGVVAGGAAVYLSNRLEKEPSNYAVAALQVNHLLMLTAKTLFCVNIPLGILKYGIQLSFLAAPVAIAYALDREVTPLSPEQVAQWNTCYRVGVAALAVLSLALGHPLFALSTLACLALDHYAKEQPQGSLIRALVDTASKVAATIAFIGYGKQIFASQTFLGALAKISTILVGIKFFIYDNLQPSPPPPLSMPQTHHRVYQPPAAPVQQPVMGMPVPHLELPQQPQFAPQPQVIVVHNNPAPQPQVIMVDRWSGTPRNPPQAWPRVHHLVHLPRGPGLNTPHSSAHNTPTNSPTRREPSTAQTVVGQNGVWGETPASQPPPKKSSNANEAVRGSGLWD
jgi:hypothetical protein